VWAAADIPRCGWRWRGRVVTLPSGKEAHEGERILAGTIVDDIFVTGPDTMLKTTLGAVSDAFGGAVTHEWDPNGFGGFQLRCNFDTKAITIALPEKIFQHWRPYST